MGICDGRVVIVTGAGRGIGREHALEFARQGAKVLVNDLGAEVDGWDGAGRMVQSAIDAFGDLDTLVCNAGILRDRMLVNMSEDDWDAVIAVHLKGHFCPLRHAAGHWREQVKSTGEPVKARVVFTSSPAGIFGNVGQLNYSAAKSGIATMARVAGAELKRYGVLVNAIAPAARTRMTEGLFPHLAAPDDASVFDAGHPGNISPLVVWLGSNDNTDVTGQTFDVAGGKVVVVENWRLGPEQDKRDRWHPAELGPVVRDLVAKSEQVRVIGAQP